MLKIWNKPHPFIFNAYSVVIPSLITLIILLLFRPFSIGELDSEIRFIVCFSISILVAISIFFTVKTLKALFPEMMSEEDWTVGKEFLLVITVLCTIVILTLFGSLAFMSETGNITTLFIKTAGLTIGIGIFPIIISILFEQFRHQKSQLARVSQLTSSLEKRNHQLEKEKSENSDSIKVLVKSEKNDVELQLDAPELIFIKSDGNYLEVYFKRNDRVEKKLVRNKLKSIETDLSSKHFFRCHNRYIINYRRIVKVEGNARNLSLFLKDVEEPIPVSRTKANNIEDFLKPA